MIKRRSTIGLALLCALAFSAIAASNALAVKGTTAYTCAIEPEKKGDWSDAHCTVDGKGQGTWEHEEIEPNSPTVFTASNQKTAGGTKEHTPAVWHLNIKKIPTTITCTEEHGEGVLTNNPGPPMSVSGGLEAKLKDCEISGEMEKEKCKLKGATVQTQMLFSTPTESMEVKFTQKGEQPIGTFTLEGCIDKKLNAEYKITGSYTAIPNGTTWKTTEASSKGLELEGEPAILTSTTTLTMGTGESGISFTTTEP